MIEKQLIYTKNALLHSSLFSIASAVRILVVLVGTIGVISVGVSAGTLSMVYFLLLLGVIGLVASRWVGAGDERVQELFITVYFFNVVIMVLVYHYYNSLYGTPYYSGGSDDLWYELNTKAIVSRTSLLDFASMRNVVHSRYYGYFYVLSFIQRLGDALGGAHTLNPRLLNSFALALVSVLIFQSGKASSFSTKVSLGAAYLSGLFPLMSYWAAFSIKDILIVLLVVGSVYLFITLKLNHGLGFVYRLVLLTGLLGILWEFRSLNVILILLLFTIEFGWTRWRQSYLIGRLVTLGLTVGLFGLLWSAYQSEILHVYSRLDIYEVGRLERAAPDGLSRFIFTAPAPYTYFLRVVYALVSPLPVFNKDIARLYVNLGTVIWFFLMPFLFFRVVPTLKKTSQVIIVLMFIGIFLSASVIGYVERQVLPAFPFAFLLAVDGLERHNEHAGRIGLFMAWMGGLLMPLYVFLKMN